MTADQKEYYEERAAILEYCGENDRVTAEYAAMLETLEKWGGDE